MHFEKCRFSRNTTYALCLSLRRVDILDYWQVQSISNWKRYCVWSNVYRINCKEGLVLTPEKFSFFAYVSLTYQVCLQTANFFLENLTWSYNKRVQHKPHRKNFSLKEQLDWVMLNLHAGGFWNKWMLEMYNNKVLKSLIHMLEYWHTALRWYYLCRCSWMTRPSLPRFWTCLTLALHLQS